MRFVAFPVVQRAVSRELLVTFLFSSAVMLGIISVVSFFQLAYRFDELGTTFLLHLIPSILVFAVTITLPVAFLLALTFTFSRMEADNEISTLQVSGVHLVSVFAPAFAMAGLLCAFSFYIQAEVMPRAHQDQRRLIREGLNNVLANLQGAGRTIKFHPEYRFHFDSAEANVIHRIYLNEIDKKSGQLKRRIVAETATWRFDEKRNILRLELHKAEFTQYRLGKPERFQKVKTEAFPFEINFEEILARRPKRLHDLPLSELAFVRREKRSLRREEQPRQLQRWSVHEVDVAYYRRFAEAAAPLIFVLLGAPLGILARTRSRLVAFFVGFLPILAVYYPLVMLGTHLGDTGTIPPWLGVWGGNILMGWAGVTLTARIFRR